MEPQMSRDDILNRLKALLVQEIGLSESSVGGGDLPLVGESSGIDSIGVLRLVMAVEKLFEIIIDDADVIPENFQTLAGLADLIERKLV
jgi:acyl carrier protein